MRKILFAIISVLMCAIGLTSCEKGEFGSSPIEGTWITELDEWPEEGEGRMQAWVFWSDKYTCEMFFGTYKDDVFYISGDGEYAEFNNYAIDIFRSTKMDYTYRNGKLSNGMVEYSFYMPDKDHAIMNMGSTLGK